MGQAMSNPCCGRERLDKDAPCMPLRRITALQDARVHFINDAPMMCILRDSLAVCPFRRRARAAARPRRTAGSAARPARGGCAHRASASSRCDVRLGGGAPRRGARPRVAQRCVPCQSRGGGAIGRKCRGGGRSCQQIGTEIGARDGRVVRGAQTHACLCART